MLFQVAPETGRRFRLPGFLAAVGLLHSAYLAFAVSEKTMSPAIISVSVPFGRVNPHFDAVAGRIRIGAQCFHRLFPISFRPDVGGADDPGPFRHLDLQLRGELLGTITHGLKTERRQPFLRIGITDDSNDFLMEPRGYVFWRAGRNQNADPGVAIEVRIARFGD